MPSNPFIKVAGTGRHGYKMGFYDPRWTNFFHLSPSAVKRQGTTQLIPGGSTLPIPGVNPLGFWNPFGFLLNAGAVKRQGSTTQIGTLNSHLAQGVKTPFGLH